MGSEVRGLDARCRDVLASVVAAHIRSAAPVSSRQLEKEGGFGLSSASIRNAMADLEDLGFLTHPHVSAGRVPTDLGYRTFVSDLMTARTPTPEERRAIERELGSTAIELDRFVAAASRLLSRLTGEAAVVVAPDAGRFVLRSVHFARVSESRLLVVQVSDTGLVETRVIDSAEEFTPAELEAVSRRLTADYAGRSLAEARRLLLEALLEEKVRFDAALRRTLELGRRAFSGGPADDPGLVVEGAEHLLEKPEYQRNVDGLRKMLHAFDERARLVRLLTDCLTAPGTSVVIGGESPLTDETQSAVVVHTWTGGGRIAGAVGVIGPRRLEYSRIVPLVEEVGRSVTRRLSEARP
ncbi:heat-inducible transcription repressor HrcA [Acidobacteria bacterium ACD]|nr:heat-inducible transcription repressor HrcA [Acidobacteria bacterium ACD]